MQDGVRTRERGSEVPPQTRPAGDMVLGLEQGDGMEAVCPSSLEDEPSCGACGEVFAEPVVLSCVCCGRSFCGACLLRRWERSGSQDCPLCDGEPGGTACAEHGRRLALFCLEDLRPVCAACPGAARHSGHRVYPLKEAAHDCKVFLGGWV
ncbi:E3 ubiquitin-protein ligase TRIM7-like [Anguilla rostrata]|uniref:E3 ubiquitin-protein ligase TRIM7-like n=1 Tax=Anguilla rostrata TaxID=7938 RepID=UPI0030CBEB61